MRIAVVGASGRMGRAIVRLASEGGIQIACAVGVTDVGRDAGELAGIGPIGTAVVDALAALEATRVDAIIDFSAPNVTIDVAAIAAVAGSALVSGTTGIGAAGVAALDRAAARAPVLWEPNMSLGVHVLSQLVARAAEALADWDIEIVETHHRAKVDAPSGTALRLAEVAQRARAGSRIVHGREGRPGARLSAEIGMHAVRGGDVIGDHVVHLLGGSERLEITHRATNRDVFAHGAIAAARWLSGREPGKYTLTNVLGAC